MTVDFEYTGPKYQNPPPQKSLFIPILNAISHAGPGSAVRFKITVKVDSA